MRAARQKKSRVLTGRAVLLWLVGFFAVVFAVNGVFVTQSESTHGRENATHHLTMTVWYD